MPMPVPVPVRRAGYLCRCIWNVRALPLIRRIDTVFVVGSCIRNRGTGIAACGFVRLCLGNFFGLDYN